MPLLCRCDSQFWFIWFMHCQYSNFPKVCTLRVSYIVLIWGYEQSCTVIRRIADGLSMKASCIALLLPLARPGNIMYVHKKLRAFVRWKKLGVTYLPPVWRLENAFRMRSLNHSKTSQTHNTQTHIRTRFILFASMCDSCVAKREEHAYKRCKCKCICREVVDHMHIVALLFLWKGPQLVQNTFCSTKQFIVKQS